MSALLAVALVLTAEEPALRRAPLPIAAAVFPGALAHGSGHMAAGDWRTGKRLLAMEGIGIAAALGGLTALAVTGASRRMVVPMAATVVGGFGLFAVSWLADLYGVVAPPAGEPLLLTPTVEARVGARYVHDPTLAYRTLLGAEADLRWRAFRA